MLAPKIKNEEMEKYTVIIRFGNTFWCKKGTTILHRLDGPAKQFRDGTKVWCIDGKIHRLDGPAIEDSDGTNRWFIAGLEYSEEQFKNLTS